MDYRMIVMEALAFRDGVICGVCHKAINIDERMEIDHKLAVINGGSDAYSNLQLVHATCNKVKGYDSSLPKLFIRSNSIREALDKTGGNRKAAARLLGISRATF